MKLVDTYSEGDYREIEVYECSCGRRYSIESDQDYPAFCPCEVEE